MSYKIYLAGYIQGTCIEQCVGWRKRISRALQHLDVEFLDPLCGKDIATIRADGLKSNRSAHAIVYRDRASVKAADMIVVNMDTFGTARGLCGTICELAWAFDWEKPIIMVTNEDKYKLHPFLSYFASEQYESVTEMLDSGIIQYFIQGVNNAVY